MKGVQISSDGLEALDNQLNDFLEVVGDALVGGAKDRSPIDTGLLKATIEVKSMDTSEDNKKVVVGDSVPYGRFQELGFHHRDSGKFIQNPFLRPSLDNVMDEIRVRL